MFKLLDLVFLITTSRPAFLHLATHLLQDTRYHFRVVSLSFPTQRPHFLLPMLMDNSDQTSPRLATLAELFAATSKGKRKRSVSHIEGIPISLIVPPTLPYRAASKLEGRRIVGNRRVMDLDDAMSCLSVSGSGDAVRLICSHLQVRTDEDDSLLRVRVMRATTRMMTTMSGWSHVRKIG